MKKMNRTFMAAGLMLVSVAMAARQEGTLLRRTLKENSTDAYTVEAKVAQTISMPNGMGDQDMTISTTSTYEVKTGKVDTTKNIADVTIVTTVDKVDADGPMGQAMAANKPKPVTSTGTIDAFGRIVVKDSAAAAAAALQNMGGNSSQTGTGLFIDFPEKAVKIGDTWDVVVPKSPMTGDTDQKLTAKLTGEKKQGDVDVWIIDLTGTLKMDLDTSKLPKDTNSNNPMAGQTMHIKGTMDIATTSLIEKSSGRTVHSDGTVKSKNTVEVMGMNIDSTGTTTMHLDLKK